MAGPTVSVIIPTFNREGLLQRALESVHRQTRPADEIVLVDDGSEDATDELVRSRFPHVRYVRQAWSGVSAARNRGVREASGEWIAFLDSDDEWVPEKLARQLEALSSAPGYRVCHTNEMWVRRGRRVNPRQKHEKSGGWIFEKCLPLCVISPSAVLLERDLFRDLGGFDERLPACEDYDLWLRLCCQHPVLYVPEPLVIKHGGHEDQLSRKTWGLDRFRIRAVAKLLAKQELSSSDRRAAVAALVERIEIYLPGVEKRGRLEEIAELEALRGRYAPELESPP